MVFDINEFLESVANVLDVIEIDIFGIPTNHSKRISYFSNRIAVELKFSLEEQYDLAALSILHDNGASLKILHDNLKGDAKSKQNMIENLQEHCIIGEDNIKSFPFLTEPTNIILYHHEKFDGSGFFGIQGENIPRMAQVIGISDTLDRQFDMGSAYRSGENQKIILDYILENCEIHFSKEVVAAARTVMADLVFWENLSDEKILWALRDAIPSYQTEMSYQEIHEITKIFSYIIDAKSKFTMLHSSGLTSRMISMCEFYKIEGDHFWKLVIASDLHDLGKLGISNHILDKPGKLSKEEFESIKEHPATGKFSLEKVQGFEEISEWIYNHHEKLNGSGYPRGLHAPEIDFNSRLITCLDIYQALCEERPYRQAMSHGEAGALMRQMAEDGLIDRGITEDVLSVFNN